VNLGVPRGWAYRAGVLLGLWTSDLRAAVPTVAECLVQIERSPRSFEPYRCLAFNPGARRRALALEALDALARRRPDDGRPLLYRALISDLAGRPVDDREFEEAARRFAVEGSVEGQIYALTTLTGARCFARNVCDQRSDEALIQAERLAEVSTELSSKRLVQVWRLRMALVRDDLAAAERAVEALTRLGGSDPPWLAIRFHDAKASLHSLLEDFDAARAEYLELARASAEGSTGRVQGQAGAAGAAAMLALRGRFDRAAAERELRAALVEEERASFLLFGNQGLYSTQVELALLLGQTEESWALLRASLAGQEARQGWNWPHRALWLMARLAAEGDANLRSSALELSDRALALTEKPGMLFENARSRILRAYVLFRLGRFDEARVDARAGLDLAERLRRQQATPSFRMRYEETVAPLYQMVAGSLLAFGGPRPAPETIAESLQTLERLRSRSLLEALLLARREGSAGSAVIEPPPPGLSEIQAALRPEQALVSYQLWSRAPTVDSPYESGTSWAVVITRSAIRAVPIEDGEAIDSELKLWLPLFEANEPAADAGAARLHRQLLAPVLAQLEPGIRELVIVPDGPLHRLPFDALRSSRSERYLAERFETTRVPSVAVWLRLQRTGTGLPGLLVALADPPAQRTGTGSAPLPGARREAGRAVGAFPGGSRLVTGADASESLVKRGDLGPFALLHFATHAVVDERNPEQSSVLLAGDAAGDDGRLTVPEIAGLGLGGKVVVLAACDSSVGPLRGGEGVLSLARAFFEAGATTVVGTLGAVRDGDSAAFFEDFYGALERSRTVGAALTEAKRVAIRRGIPAGVWSRFVVLGNGAAIPRASTPLRWRWALGALLLATLAGAAIIQRSKASSRRRRNARGDESVASGG